MHWQLDTGIAKEPSPCTGTSTWASRRSYPSRASLDRPLPCGRPPVAWRAVRRCARRNSVVPLACPGFLGRESVSDPTVLVYRNAVTDFESWARVNSKTEKYCDLLFFDRAAPWEGNTLSYGLSYTRGESSRAPDVRVKTQRAIKGWACLDPPRSRDPMPEEVALLTAEESLRSDTLEAVQTSTLTGLAFDTYLRPNEALNPTVSSVVPPAPAVGAAYSRWAVVVTPEGSECAAKNQQYDQTTLVGLREGERQRIDGVLSELYNLARQRETQQLLWAVDLPISQRGMKAAHAPLGLPPRVAGTPHCLRHGGASYDAFKRHLAISNINRRGRWLADRCVLRYAKHGKLSRQIRFLSTAQQRQATGTGSRLKTALSAAVVGLKQKP